MIAVNTEHKSRMLSVRLSAVEFDFLKTRYRSYGARNASDLARLAVQRVMHGWDGPVNNLAGEIASLSQRAAELSRRVERLEAEVALFSHREAGCLTGRGGPVQTDNKQEER
jgi:hypothetical protein